NINPPKDKEFTVAEIVDLINEALLAKPPQERFILIRRERTFTWVPNDEKLSQTDLQQIPLSELSKRGSTEVCVVLMSAGGAKAADIAPEIKRVLTQYGDVVVLPRSNQMLIWDKAGTLRRVRDTFGLGGADAASATEQTITLDKASAATVATALERLLPALR